MFLSGIADEAGKPLDMQIRAHKELGWSHIEVRNVEATTLAFATDAEFDDFHARLRKAGLQVSCFASQIANWSRNIDEPMDKDLDELKKAIPRMKKMGTQFIRIMSYANKNKVPETQWRDEAIRRIKILAKMAEDGGITLCHENCDGWGGLGPKQTLELLKAVGSPALKVVFDTGNCVGHCQDPWDYYSQVKEHVLYVHIKDGVREGDHARWGFPGEGQANVRRIVADLLASGYNGGFSIEPHIASIVHEGKESTPETMYKTYVEYGRRLTALVADIRKSDAKKPRRGK